MKITNPSLPYFFEDKPLFGLDIGGYTLRVIQLDLSPKIPRLKGYGAIEFDPSAILDGVIVKPKLIAKAMVNLFKKELVGDISTKRVALSLPSKWALTHAMRLPKMSLSDLAEAVQTEIDQYIPTINGDNFYMDYTTLREEGDNIEVFVVAMPKPIVDSYLNLTRILGLEAVLFDTTIGANAHLFAHRDQTDIPSVLVDFGSKSTDLTVFNKGLVVTGTVAFGGDDVTRIIAKSLGVGTHEAIVFKSKYGLSVSRFQKQVKLALEPSLEILMREFRRTIRYYEQRYAQEPPIGQVITMGGGANMPGLADYLTERLRLPARPFYSVDHIDFGHLRRFYSADSMSYVTACGLAVTNPAELFK